MPTVRMPAARADTRPHFESSIATHSCACRSATVDRSFSAASRYGAGSGLLAGVSSADTTNWKWPRSPSWSRTRRISAFNAPDATAIGNASAMRMMASRAPGKSTEPLCSSSSRRTALRATSEAMSAAVNAVPVSAAIAVNAPISS